MLNLSLPREVAVEMAQQPWFRDPYTRSQRVCEDWITRSLTDPTPTLLKKALTETVLAIHAQDPAPCLAAPECSCNVTLLADLALRKICVPLAHADLVGAMLPPELCDAANNPVQAVSLSFSEYHHASMVALRAIGGMLQDSTENDSAVFAPASGRGSSKRFETEFAIPFLRERMGALVEVVDSALADEIFVDDSVVVRFHRLELSDPEESCEASERAPWDMRLELVATHRATGVSDILTAPVNIKYTAGDRRDNVGGAQMFAWAMLGEQALKLPSAIKLLGLCSERVGAGAATANADYFFLAFGKKEVSKTISHVWVSSLLAIDPHTGAVAHNGSQSFPRLQINYRKAADCLAEEGQLHLPISMTALETRRRFLDWWSLEEYKQASVRSEGALECRRLLRLPLPRS